MAALFSLSAMCLLVHPPRAINRALLLQNGRFVWFRRPRHALACSSLLLPSCLLSLIFDKIGVFFVAEATQKNKLSYSPPTPPQGGCFTRVFFLRPTLKSVANSFSVTEILSHLQNFVNNPIELTFNLSKMRKNQRHFLCNITCTLNITIACR